MAKGIVAGDVFGRWTVVEFSHVNKHGASQWLCRCECGIEKPVDGNRMKRGMTRSCGCLKIELSRVTMAVTATTHGMRRKSIYRTWTHMVDRCHNPKCRTFCNYGAKGIQVCNEWRRSFADFYAYMGPKPTKEHSLDRFPNQKGNYEPGNCRWADKKEQARNTKKNRMVTWNDETKCLSEWAEITGIGEATLRYRLQRGDSPAEAFSRPTPRQRSGLAVQDI